MRPILPSLLPLLLVLSCAGPRDAGTGRDKHGRTEEVAAQYAAAVERKVLKMGMHKSEIRAVMDGGPDRVSRRRLGNRDYTVWEYRQRSIDLYLDDDGYLMKWRAP